VNANWPIEEDYAILLSPDGREKSKLSLLECFQNSPYSPLLREMPDIGDVFHTNTLEVLDGRLSEHSDVFREGNLLISVWVLNTIAVVDPSSSSVVWALNGMWRRQHQPTVLDNGNLLIFDNHGNDGWSRVIEFDPFTQRIDWMYSGDPPEAFLSLTCGSCQRLPNGNTLITESDYGRAFEVTPEGEIVWEYSSPHRAGENDELIATLFEMIRLPPDFPLGWLKNAPHHPSKVEPVS
jgi:hypothetical protein